MGKGDFLIRYSNDHKSRSQWPRRLGSSPAEIVFETCRRHGLQSVGSVLCCQVEVSASNLLLAQRIPTNCGTSLFVILNPHE
jgi:hypothetical protein